MYLIRETMFCKPGQVRPLVQKFLTMSALSDKMGMPKMRVMTDVCADQYWTVVTEMEVPSLQAFESMMFNAPDASAGVKEMEKIMKGYHDLVDHGRREIYKIETGA